ncbi:MAG: DUF4397 domain-containing protein [Vicinamibacteria bacterium]
MNTRRRLIAAALASPVLLAGCKVRTINDFPVSHARVRFTNLMLGATGLDVRESDNVVWSAIPFETVTDAVEFENKEKTFTIALSGNPPVDLANVKTTLAGEQPYTFFGYGTIEVPNALMVPDTTTNPGGGKFQVRIVDVAGGLPNYDIYITGPLVPVDEQIGPNFANMSPGSASVSLRFDVGIWRIRAALATSKSVVYDSGPIIFAEGANTDFVLYATGAATLPQGMRLDVNDGGTRAQQPSTVSTVKFLNAATGTGSINAFIDGTKAIDTLPYPGASGYALSTTGSHAITIEPVITPGATVASLAANLPSARESTVLVYGLPGAVQALLLLDDNREPASGLARVRFVNGVSDGKAYDIFVNDTRIVTALPAAAASGYSNFSAGTYTVTWRDPATGAIALTLADQAIGEARVLSVCIAGTSGQLASFVSTDR